MHSQLLLEDPDFLPFKLDLPGGRALFLRLSAQQRLDAPFLDERGIPPQAEGFWLPLEALHATTPEVSVAPDFIFHIGHCGSTLLSRLLGLWPEIQVLREPLPLRTLGQVQGNADAMSATQDWQSLLVRLLGLWARPQAPHRRVLIKATSNCNGLVAPILQQFPSVRAILLDMPLESYLATLFKSPDSIRDAAIAAPLRRRFLAAQAGTDAPPSDSLDYPQMCAMGWLAEQLRFSVLAGGPAGTRLLRVNFDELLSMPQPSLAAVVAHLGLDYEHLDSALTSPAWERYSKAQGHAYNREDRGHDLALARQRFGPQIAAGRAWVHEFLGRHPQLALAELRFE